MEFVQTEKAPQAVGPYSQAVISAGSLYCSGQIPLIPETGELIGDDIVTATKQVLKNMEAVLTAGGSSKEQVVKVTAFVRDMGQFKTINEVYSEFFGAHKPARAVVEVSKLPLDAIIEMDCIAEVR